MSRSDVVPEVLWTPTPQRVARAAMTDFTSFVADRTGRELPDYSALWEFSTQDLAGFLVGDRRLLPDALARAAKRGTAGGCHARR